jgi:hypothetical protein
MEGPFHHLFGPLQKTVVKLETKMLIYVSALSGFPKFMSWVSHGLSP